MENDKLLFLNGLEAVLIAIEPSYIKPIFRLYS
jgi:hypothetical protein